MIDSHRFGKMVIDGQKYDSDLMILPDGRVLDNWRRRQGHHLSFADIKPLTDTGPELIIAGTGTSGLMQPDPELAGALSEMGIDLIAKPNKAAVQLYNEQAGRGSLGFCVHLTC